MTSSSQLWLDTRSAGVLAHLSTLPGAYGIGNLGPGARRFVDFLSETGVRYWQICPIGPTGYGDSPYQLFSGRAGNPYLIDLGELVAEGLLTEEDLVELKNLPSNRVDYGRLYELFWNVLAKAQERFVARGKDSVGDLGSFRSFVRKQDGWLEPFCDFMALKEYFGGYAWTTWPDKFRLWTPKLGSKMPASAKRSARRHAFYQYLFFGQWKKLRDYAASRGVGIIGDVPIFVALDSADTWQNRDVFKLDVQGQPLAVAGVPPDYFSATGQLWGNPLYDWDRLAKTGYAWWIARLRSAFELYDIIRLDHFRGFHTYWEIPAGSPDASTGRWRKGPGLAFFRAVKKALPNARIIAEDLGYIGPQVVEMRRRAELPGMKILQFAYGHDAHNINLPHYYPPDSIAYIGTHDNNTAVGWLDSLTPEVEKQVREYFQLGNARSAWPLIRILLSTVSRMAVVTMQDLLDLPASATFNRPGTSEDNWQWRFTDRQLDGLRREKLETLKAWITLYDRSGDHPVRDYSEPMPH